MTNFHGSRWDYAFTLINSLFHRKNLLVFLGKNGATIGAFKRDVLQDSIYANYNSDRYNGDCRNFIQRYKNYSVTFLLDNKEAELHHEMLPILSSLIKSNPVEKFISEKYKPDDIVAYNVYEITNSGGEVWNTTIALSPFCPPLSDILEYAIKKSYKYDGVYFLSLEIRQIINRILKISDNSEHLDKLIFFTVITKNSQIRIFVKYKDNVMSEQTFELPLDKSDMYVIGVIEQALSDKLLYYKEYITTLKTPPCMVFLIDDTLKELIPQLKFQDIEKLAFTQKELGLSEKCLDGKFQDLALLELLDHLETNLGSNKPLKAITKYTLLDAVIFKPIIAIIIAMVIYLSFIKYQIININSDTKDLNNQYYKLAQDYRDIKKRNPDISNISDLLEVHNLDNVSARISASPYNDLNYIIANNNSYLKIKRISWKLIDVIPVNFPESGFDIFIDVVYSGQVNSSEDSNTALVDYKKYLENNFSKHKVNLFQDTAEDMQLIGKTVDVLGSFTIKGIVGEEKNAK